MFAGRIDSPVRARAAIISPCLSRCCACPPRCWPATAPGFLPVTPLLLQMAVVIAAEQLTTAYKIRCDA